MTTTGDSLSDDGGVVLALVLAIEGWHVLYTSWPTTAPIVTAWAATPWSTAATGLEIADLEIEESLQPFRDKLDPPLMRFLILNETLAQSIWATEKSSGNVAKLQENSDPTDTTLVVDSTTGFSANNDIYIGTERANPDSISGGNTFNCAAGTRGIYAPFGTSAGTNLFAREHRLSRAAGAAVAHPLVTDYPRVWEGKDIGLWVHRVKGGVLDVYAQAELVFGGKIRAISEENGSVAITAARYEDHVASATLFGDQWTATLKESVFIKEGSYIEIYSARYSSTETIVDSVLQKLTVGAAGAGGDIDEGYHTIQSIVDGFNSWFASVSTPAHAWKMGVDGVRTSFHVFDPGAAAGNQMRADVAATKNLAILIGASDDVTVSEAFITTLSDVVGGGGGDIDHMFYSPHPYALAVIDPADYTGYETDTGAGGTAGSALEVENASGTWLNQQTWFPRQFLETYTEAGENWGFVQIEDKIVGIARYTDDTALAEVHYPPALQSLFGTEARLYEDGTPRAIRAGEAMPRIKQLIWIQDRAQDLMVKLFASTGAAYNEATYDVLPYQLSLAVPWDILGDGFVESVKAMVGDVHATMTVVLTRPTAFIDILTPELLVRGAHLTFKSGGLRFVQPTFPGAGSTALHSFTELTKGVVEGQEEMLFATYRRSLEWLINQFKLEYNRDINGTFHSVLEISNEQSVTDFGVGEPITISLFNHFGDVALDDSIREAAAMVAGYALTVFSKPLVNVRVPISRALWDVYLGDQGTLTDNKVRDPATGTEGVTAKPCTVIGKTFNWATQEGFVDLLLTPDDRYTVYSPCADVNEDANTGGFTAGYDGVDTLRCKANVFSLAADGPDASFFLAGEEIDIIERSPATPASPVRWTRTILAINSNDIQLTSGLSSPAFDANLAYRISSVDRSAADATQTPDAYQADAADGMIQDTVRPALWGSQVFGETDTGDVDSTLLHEYPVNDGTWKTEGEAVHPGMHQAAVRTANTMVQRKTTPQVPILLQTAITTTSSSYVVVGQWRRYISGARWTTGTRKLTFSVRSQTSSAAETVTVRVSLSPYRAKGATMTSATLPTLVKSTEVTLTGTTSPTISAAQTSDIPLPSGLEEWIYVIVEMKITGGATGTFYGLPEMWHTALA